MISISAIFEKGLPAFHTQSCVIEDIERMDHSRFREFCDNLLSDQQFIVNHKEDMFVDSNGNYHVLLALDMENGDGILINSSGYRYARYASFMPNIKPYLDRQIAIVAE